jgi:hypothetical protein
MKTKRNMLCTLVTVIVILLTGCSGEVSSAGSSINNLPIATQLVLGTIKLEGTDQAVVASQAIELLTLWQAYQSLTISDTTSQVELDALVEQIQAVMTSKQIKAIEAMDLTLQSLDEVLQTIGTDSGEDTPAIAPDESAQSPTSPMGGPGGMPAGGDSLMSEIGNGITPQSTREAIQPATSRQTTQVDARILVEMIRMLETRSQAAG